MLNTQTLYHYNDVMIQPSVVSNIKSRSECNPFTESNMLPIFTAPMSSIVDMYSALPYVKNKITPIVPRSVVSLAERIEAMSNGFFSAFSLNEFKDNFIEPDSCNNYNILIDIANGHMSQLFEVVRECKKNNPKVTIMIGNIANPDTYELAEDAGADFVRIGIGAGEGCITSSNTGIHYPMASLIYDTWKVKNNCDGKCKIVADGGIRNYSDVIKALALGADYVMIGGLFGRCIEICQHEISASDKEEIILDADQLEYLFNNNYSLFRKFYGMSSSLGQIDINGSKNKTSEGICKLIKVDMRLSKWSENMADYLRSAMSYCDVTSLDKFNPKFVQCNVISNNSKNSINK